MANKKKCNIRKVVYTIITRKATRLQKKRKKKLNPKLERLLPTKLPILGQFHPLMLAEISVCGSNSFGVLGVGNSTTTLSKFTQIESIVETIDDSSAIVVSLSCGSSHQLLCLSTGAVLVWGRNDHSQLGFGYQDSQSQPQSNQETPKLLPLSKIYMNLRTTIVSVSAGSHHSMMITSRGALFTFGKNGKYGE